MADCLVHDVVCGVFGLISGMKMYYYDLTNNNFKLKQPKYFFSSVYDTVAI